MFLKDSEKYSANFIKWVSEPKNNRPRPLMQTAGIAELIKNIAIKYEGNGNYYFGIYIRQPKHFPQFYYCLSAAGTHNTAFLTFPALSSTLY